MEKNSLEDSIRDESQRAIQVIRDKEESEIKRLDDIYSHEIEEYRKKKDAEIDVRIEQEFSKIENRGILECRKLELSLIEDFISRAVEEAVKGLRDDPRYKHFLWDTISNADEQIHAHAEVHLREQDRALGEEIIKELKSSTRDYELIIHEDNMIKWGGCIINDEEGGRMFNGTVERICFRKYQVIRQEISRIIRGKGLIE